MLWLTESRVCQIEKDAPGKPRALVDRDDHEL